MTAVIKKTDMSMSFRMKRIRHLQSQEYLLRFSFTPFPVQSYLKWVTDQEMQPLGEQRKARSMARLTSDGIPVLDWLPWIECDPTTIQPLETIARRTTVLALLAVYAEPNGMPKDELQKHLDNRGITKDLTPEEQAFVKLTDLTDDDRGKFTCATHRRRPSSPCRGDI